MTEPEQPSLSVEAPEPPSACPVVGIGASAGGLAALEGFFAHVPPDARLAFVVVQHLSADHPSSMPEILSKQTSMPIGQAVDGTAVEPGHVYTIPPNAALTINGGVLSVTTPAEPRHGLIDHFLISLAKDQGQSAIGVILSGAGTDGTFGLKAIKEHGGFSIAQSIESAAYDSMPRSAIDVGLADLVLPVEAMGVKIVEYADHLRTIEAAEAGPEGNSAAYAENLRLICAILLRQTRNDFSKYKRPTLERRIQRRLLVTQAGSLSAYVEILRSSPDEVTALFKDLLIGVTQFFRDTEAFAALASVIVPKLMKGKGEDHEFRVWVAGCASGEEAYSIAILLREAMAKQDHSFPVKIFATDIDEGALEVARQGRYPEVITEHISPERLERYFTKQGGVYQIEKSIRELCIFSAHNLIRDPPFSRLNLISCRNLLIYLESEIQRRLVPVFHYALRPGGVLFLGPSESIATSPELFTLVDKKYRIFQRNDAVIPPFISFPVAGPGSIGGAGREGPPRPAPDRGDAIGKVFERVLVDNYSPAAVVINERAEIVFISGSTGKYLELPVGVTNVNVIDMARRGLRPDLHTAIHKAIRVRQETFHEGVMVEINGHVQRINLSVRPLVELEAGSGLFMVVFQDVGPPIPKDKVDAASLPRGSDQELAKMLENELRATKDHLRTTIEGFEASNEELKSANEELISTNEELQSTNEELQTSKEELQSMNEELHTVNAELSRKVEELDQANSDLSNLFASTNIATIFLDGDLHIKKFSPEAAEVFRIIGSDVGRPITDIAATLIDSELVSNLRDVLRTLIPKEKQVRRVDPEQWYIQRIQPYRTVDNVIGGAVITYVEITALKRAERRVAHFAALVDSAQDAIIGMDRGGVIVSWNAGAARMFGYSKAEAIGRLASILVPPVERAAQEDVYASLVRKDAAAVEPFEAARLRKDGSLVDVYITYSSVVEDDGVISGVSMIAHDITERREAERRKSQFLAVLGHELRNPLAPLKNALFIMRTFGESFAPPVKQSVEMIDRQVTHLTSLVDGLLDVSRISNGKLLLQKEPLDLAELCGTVLEDHHPGIRAAGIELDFSAPGGPVWVEGDRIRLAQVVTNLVHNAVKFTNAGGHISVEARPEPASGVGLVRVRDSGIGMSNATLVSLFVPFAQADTSLARSQGGLGLGLAVIKGIVELHGGRVEASSAGLGHGSEFTIRLPLLAQAEMPVPTPPRKPTASGRPRRILVVDDNMDIVDSIRLVLEFWKHEVAVAYTGKEALDVAKAFCPEIVLCDIGLPGGMDGYELAKALGEEPQTSAAHRIALSGYGQEDDRRRAIEAGFEEHLTKPVEPEELKSLLASLS